MSNRIRGMSFDATPVPVDLKEILGGLLGIDWRQALIARGFGWHVQVGALTTPIVGGGNGTVLDLEQPELAINVPAGYAMIPLRIGVQTQIGLQTTDAHENEIIIGVDRTQIQVAGTSTAETMLNLRTDLVATAPFTCFSAYTADGVATPVINELARKQSVTDVQTAVGVNVYQFDLLYEPLVSPIIIGPAHIAVYWGGDIALPGFAQAFVLAVPSNLFTGLS